MSLTQELGKRGRFAKVSEDVPNRDTGFQHFFKKKLIYRVLMQSKHKLEY